MSNQNKEVIGFIGLGVMGEPICRNLARKSAAKVLPFDLAEEPLNRLAADGVERQGSAIEVMKKCDVVFLSLPLGEIVAQLCRQEDGLLSAARPGQIVIDLSTSPVDTTRELEVEFAAKQTKFVNAPVARTRAALKKLLCATALLMFGIGTAIAQSENYPTRPILLVVPFAAGGTTDIVTRLLGKELSEQWKVPVTIDNRAGAGGIIGATMVAHSVPDGYTLLMATVATHGINASLYSKLPYDPVKDFDPISLVASTPSVLMVNQSVPANSVSEFIAYAKTNPGTLNFGSSGNGSSHHLAGAMFNYEANVRMIHVPYKGTATMITDLLGGQIQLTFDTLPSAMPYVKSGRLKALAVTSAQRYPTLPGLPTIAETLPGYEIVSWYGMLAPAGTPHEITKKISDDIARIVRRPDFREKLLAQGATPVGSNPEQFKAYIQSELKKWSKVVKNSGAHVD